MRHRDSFDDQSGTRHRRQLRPRRDGVPLGQDIQRPMGRARNVSIEGGSIGLQLGGESTDVVLLVMNNRGVDALLSSKVKLGGNASAAAGPKGRNMEASTDGSMRAEILSYSRSRGLFAG